MTTTPRFTGRNATANYMQWLVDDAARAVAQALAEGRILRNEAPTWQEDALARAGDYALAGEWRESRRFAKLFVEGE